MTEVSPPVDRAEVRRLLAAYICSGRTPAALEAFEDFAQTAGAGHFIAGVVERWDGRHPEFRAFAENVARRIELAARHDHPRRRGHLRGR